ncbi:ligand-dependent nuclear receptor-interacting factor 1 [Colossoma macropomum]|uniref:ligand-dependent nuclear receptor-interacting factor 1 n=1 Tax=Colossoma macropomum TaxID=42526 RepID=UPI001864E53F|nr:ligand-dependent nuclear receptor-interacting factor 1 [Colossoma macropomum]
MENKTGVYYQAMPAVGPDGKNVMKLIPVQKVNGKFVQTHVLTARNDCQPQVYSQPAHISPASLPQNKLPTLQQTADGRFILKTPPESNILFNSVKIQHQGDNDLFKNAPNQVRAPLLTTRLTQNALQLPPQNNSKTVTVINSPQQPAALKSPIFPSGHYLQIPPNATVRTLPASALPQSIKSQICNSSSALSNPAKGLPTVVYVSPVNSLKLGPNQPLPGLTKASELPKSLAQTLSITDVKSLSVSSTSSPKADQGASAPMKWIIQEGAGNAAPCLIPVSSPSMSTDILKAVRQIETVRHTNQVPAGEPTSANATQEKISPGKDNALVMCNGKVYFVAKKNSEISKDLISGVTGKVQVKNSAQPASVVSGSCTSNMVPKQDSKNTPVSKKPNEIIDLCDDDEVDEESSTSAKSSRLTVLSETAGENDEDSNVIFVSYIPPKSDTETCKKVAETAPQNGCGTDTDSLECKAGNMEQSCETNSTNSPVINLDVSRCQDNVAAHESVNGGGAASEQPEEVCDQGTEATRKISVDPVIHCRQDSEAVNEMSLEEPALEEMPQQKSDSELRQIFGITSDLKIGLQRINQAKESSPQAERRSINKRTLEGIRKLIRESQIELKIKQLIQAQVPVPKKEDGPEDAKRKRLEQVGQKTCLDSACSSVKSSSPQSEGTVNCDDEMQSASTDACADSKVLLCCQGSESETLSTSGSSEVAKPTAEPLCSSSSCQPQQIQTAWSHTDSTACTSVSRKTPPRQSKGSGRVCTACPCGTKVGVITPNSSKPQNNTSSAAVVDPSKQASVFTESNTDCNTVDKVLENSVLDPPMRNDELEKSEDEAVHSGQSYPTPGEGSLQTAASLAMQQDSVSQAGLSSQGKTCCSSISRDTTPGKTCEEGTGGHVEAAKLDLNNPKDVKAPSSSVGEMFGVGENMPSEFYSSIMLDPEEVKRRERIKRLKDLLKEKEAALEKLRKSM